MSQDSQQPDERPDYPVEHVGHLAGQAEQPPPTGKKPWFAPNSGGVGYHPQTWQGVLIIVLVIIVITFLIAALKKGWF
ncbi:MAG: hypothetical protein FWF75_06265 [Propionibacteriaceae bacterium]|nr:hypothetical protein [Propionibacteriaceae bacterium]